MYRLTYLTFFLFLIFSCSKDPCEGITCANGDCNDGSCACDIGWKGERCDEIDFNFIGEYEAESITYSNCDDASNNGVWQADQFNNFCYPDGDVTTCFSFHLEIKPDGTFKQFWVDTKITGGFTVSEQDPSDGTYEVNNGEITLCSPAWSNCETMTVNDARSGIEWKITNKGNSGCFRTYSIIKE